MLDENIWTQLNESEKIDQLKSYLDELIAIDNGSHTLSNKPSQGQLAQVRKEAKENIFKIIELENSI